MESLPVPRPMRWWDIEAVMLLERELFPDDAWSSAMFWSELAEPAMRRYYVTEEPGTGLTAYAGLAVVGDEADVQTIAVRRDRWGTGLGARMLGTLLDEAVSRGCRRILLEVRVDNTRAQKLYERFGFKGVGVRRGYYQPAGVDALVMRCDLTERDERVARAERDESKEGTTSGGS